MPHSSGAAETAAIAPAAIQRQRTPDRNSTMPPPAATSSEVPRSGWPAISSVGTAISNAQTRKSTRPGGNGFLCSQAASIRGTPIFIISEG